MTLLYSGMPSDIAASIWPRSIDWMAPRTISAPYAPKFRPSTTMPATSGTTR